jgi:myo-inositol-1(or 4)-monophosphatase
LGPAEPKREKESLMAKALKDYLDFALETAHAAGRLTLGYFQAGVQAEFKADDTPVTVADRRAEELIRERLAKRYPTHAILGEEHGAQAGSEGDPRWIIDPIDGTKAFMRGVPLYAVLIGLEIDGRCEVGVAYFPALDDMIYAATGCGCFWNGRPARVAKTSSLKKSFVGFTGAESFEPAGRFGVWQRFLRASYGSVGWSDAYGHALVATGRMEVMLDPVINPYDCAPFPPILREAGGYFGDWSGKETIYGGEGLSTTQTLLPQVLDLVQNSAD